MQTVNNVLRCSCFISGLTGLMLLSGIASLWLIIKLLAVLAGITG